MARKKHLAPIDPNSHSLRQEHREQIAQLLFLKQHHQELIAGIEAQVATILKIGYGADINSENWHLDLDQGLLTRDTGTSE